MCLPRESKGRISEKASHGAERACFIGCGQQAGSSEIERGSSKALSAKLAVVVQNQGGAIVISMKRQLGDGFEVSLRANSVMTPRTGCSRAPAMVVSCRARCARGSFGRSHWERSGRTRESIS